MSDARQRAPSAGGAGELALELVELRPIGFEEIAQRADLFAHQIDRRRDRSAIARAARQLTRGDFETAGRAVSGLGLGQQDTPLCRNAIQNPPDHL